MPPPVKTEWGTYLARSFCSASSISRSSSTITVSFGTAGAGSARLWLQAALGAVVIVCLNDVVGLDQSAWAITACTYVVAGSTAGTIDRVRRRIIGTIIGVPLGITCLPLAVHVPLLAWSASALAMVIYAMALQKRYDIACGAYAFTLLATLALTGESALVLASRAWETLLGAGLGATAALVVLPLRPARLWTRLRPASPRPSPAATWSR